MVRKPYRMLGISDAQFFLAPSNCFFKPWRIALFVTSVWPFVCGWATKENLFHIPMFLVKSLKELQSNYFQLSEISILSIPNQQMILPHTKSITFLESSCWELLLPQAIREILHSYYYELLLPYSLREWSQYIYFPFREWPRARYTWLRHSWHVDHICEPLVDITCFYEISSFLLYPRPIIPLPKNLVCQCNCSFMNPIDSLVYFLNYSWHFFWSHTSQLWVRFFSSI